MPRPGTGPRLLSQAEREPGCACPPGGSRPLPDPAAVRLCRVPDSAPPYDDADGRARPGRRADARAAAGPADQDPAVPADQGLAGQGEAGQGEAHTGPPGDAGGDRRPGVPHETAAPGTAGRRERGGASGNQPPPGWPSRFAQVLAETLAGSRPPRQLVPWTTERARTHIRRLGAQLSAAEQPRIRRVITSRPAPEVVEMTVIVGFGPRVRALAIRLEQAEAAVAPGLPARPPRWVCTAVEAA